MVNMPKVLITGSSGLIGMALGKHLSANGYEIGRLSRSSTSKDVPHWNPGAGVIDFGSFSDADIIIHLAGDNIAEGRWNAAKKARILNSRVQGTKLISEYIAKLSTKPKVLISGSAIGIYGDSGDKIVDERSELGTSFLSEVCKQWEESTRPALDAGIRVVNVRMGMVLSPTGGALQKMIRPFKLGLGGTVGNGKQYMSWVSINDVVKIFEHVMENKLIQGPVNFVSPNPVSNYEYTKALGRALHRLTILPIPAFVARLLFGEMANELLLSSTRVMPQQLLSSGFEFQHSKLDQAFESLLKKKLV